ncbi:hypothetical protein [Erwinia sp. E_sp_W01_6]
MGQTGEGLAEQLGRVNTVPVTPVDASAIAHIEHIADWYLQQGIIKTKPDITSHVITLTP